ncbi:MAG TPA: hypothetical protein VFU59_06635 [Candidatus Eisenbacteria bacterium]|nr:hypothetical protein [Candidatus Eisenbacteria bacterium]
MTGEGKKLFGKIILGFGIIVSLANAFLYGQGHGSPALVTSGSALTVIGIVILARAKRDESKS